MHTTLNMNLPIKQQKTLHYWISLIWENFFISYCNHLFPPLLSLAPHSLPHFNLSPLTFSSPEHLSRQLLWSLAQSKMIKAFPEAGTGKGGGQREMRARGHRGHRWKSVEVVPANSCCVSRAPDWTHTPIGRNSASRAPDWEGERDRKRDERRGDGSGNAGNEVEMSTLSLTLYLTRTAVQVRDRNGSKPQCKRSFCKCILQDPNSCPGFQ